MIDERIIGQEKEGKNTWIFTDTYFVIYIFNIANVIVTNMGFLKIYFQLILLVRKIAY